MNEAKRSALVAITRKAMGMADEQSGCCGPSQSLAAPAEEQSACCPTPQPREPAEAQAGCCPTPRDTVVNDTIEPDSRNASEKCCSS